MKRALSCLSALVAVLGLVVVSTSLAGDPPGNPPLSGAIFTTNADGSVVNGNIYADKCDVYLDGGPGPNAPPDAAGLPDGDYYFQVTDPSGKTLLSTDAVVHRQFEVVGGLIVGVSGAGNHLEGLDLDQFAATIQLCPFASTPNNGGVYKVWVTRVQDFVGDPLLVDNGYEAGYFHGFIPSWSKVDNFKVKSRGLGSCLTVTKFNDLNCDGLRNGKGATLEPELNWPVIVRDVDGCQVGGILYTPFTLCNLVPGEYTVDEAEHPDWMVTATFLDGKRQEYPGTHIHVWMGRSNRSVMFGNVKIH